MPRLRPRTAGLAFGALLLFGIGTSVQAGWLLVLSSCLLGTAIAGAFLPLAMVRGVEVERRSPTETFQGDRVGIDLAVTNASRGTRLGLLVEDPHVTPAVVFVPRLAPGGSVILSTERIAARRGVHASTEVVVSSSAPFGVAVRRRRLEVPGGTVVYPTLVRLDDLPFLGASPTAERAIHSAPRRGGGPDYLGIREYRWGDSMRHVHWPSTARTGELMVREFEREETRRLAVVIDTSADVGASFTPLDACCSVAASVAFAASGRAQGVRLIAAAEGEPRSLVRAAPDAMLRWLAELRPFGGVALPELLGELGSELHGTETVLVALPTWRSNAPDAVAAAVDELLAVVPAVVAVLVEVQTFEDVSKRRSPFLAREEVDTLADELVGVGADVRRLASGGDLTETLGRRPVGAIR
jgi:uncharacterized protein (DUF58 family)